MDFGARALEGGCDSYRKTRRVDRSDLPAGRFYSTSAAPSGPQRAALFVRVTVGRRSPAADSTVMSTNSCRAFTKCCPKPDAILDRCQSAFSASRKMPTAPPAIAIRNRAGGRNAALGRKRCVAADPRPLG